MSRAAKKVASAPAIELTIEDCIVRAARGHQRRDGGIAFSGALWVRDIPIADFANEGQGGCNSWRIRDNDYSRAMFAEFKALAARLNPDDRVEQEDTTVGLLWDAAYLRAAR